MVSGVVVWVDERLNKFSVAPTEVMGISRKQTMWLDYLPSPALLLQATPFYCAGDTVLLRSGDGRWERECLHAYGEEVSITMNMRRQRPTC